jgi:membrane protein implicated in regulation of membrane protease activity
MELVYYHWMILALGFWILDKLNVGRLTAALTFAAGVQGTITLLIPELPWGWQVWGFVMLMALGAIFSLRRAPGEKAQQRAERKLSESETAAQLVGTRVSLLQPLYPGTSKLELGGRFWKVAASRDFPAGSVVEVVGHRGNTLDIISSELPSYGSESVSSALSTDLYHRDSDMEEEYGEPDFEYWGLFHEALHHHGKVALIYAYHVLSGLKGLNLDQARAQLNTYTLALYDPRGDGRYLEGKRQMSSQPRIYNFLYMNGQWTGRDKKKFEEEINELIAALHTEWAVKYRGDIPAHTVLRAVMMIRTQQMASNAD